MTAAGKKAETQKRLVYMAREKLFNAIAHMGDYGDDEIEELIEEAIWDILAAAKALAEGKVEMSIDSSNCCSDDLVEKHNEFRAVHGKTIV